MNKVSSYSITQRFAAWSIHLLTASTAVIGLFTLLKLHQGDYLVAFWLMGLAIFIDAIDGSLARAFHVKSIVPKIDGALLDNMVDYINYVLTPCFLLLLHPTLLTPGIRPYLASLVILTSAYQFTQSDAKTSDNFFKGFPSYWNFVVFYMVLFQTSPTVNALVLMLFSLLIFVPIKYVYLSRMDHFTKNRQLRWLMLGVSSIFGVCMVFILWLYPNPPTVMVNFVIAYIALYLGLSVYRTLYPLQH